MNHELLRIFTQKLNAFTISDHYGLESPGLTCYLNTVLQVLYMTEPFREEIQRRRSKNAAAIDAHLDSLFTVLKRGSARTHSIIQMLGITELYEQRDAAEYFEKILHLTSPEASKIFRGELIHKNKCLDCDQGNDSRSNFWILPLVVKDSHHQTYSVEEGFKAFFKGDKVTEDNEMFCNSCSKKREAEIDCEITHTPEVLTLLLKRFSFNCRRRCYVKLNCNVEVPHTLPVKSYTYNLYALVHHYGDLTGGHYVAEIRSLETGQWYLFDDDVVQMVRHPENGHMRSCTAYLLMYRKGKPHSENTDRGNQEAGAEVEVKPGERHQDPLDHHHHRHMTSDLLERSRDNAVKQKHSSGEEDKQKKQMDGCERLIKEMWQPMDTGALRSTYSNTHSHEAIRQQRDTHSKVHRFGPNNSSVQRPDNTESYVGARTISSSARGRVTPVGTQGVKGGGGAKKDGTKREQLLGVVSNGHSLNSPSPSCRMNKSTAQLPVAAHNGTVEATRPVNLMYNTRPEPWK